MRITHNQVRQWRSARTTNAIERLHEAFRRRIKTQTVLPAAETAPMLFRALLAPGQITMRKVDGWQTLPAPLEPMPIDPAARGRSSKKPEAANRPFLPTSRQHPVYARHSQAMTIMPAVLAGACRAALA